MVRDIISTTFIALSNGGFFTGCSELIFNPLITWWRLGPINKQLRTFVWSKAPVHYKFTMMSCESERHLPYPRTDLLQTDMFSYCENQTRWEFRN